MKLGQLDIRNVTTDSKTARAASTTSSLRVRSSLKAGGLAYEPTSYAANYSS